MKCLFISNKKFLKRPCFKEETVHLREFSSDRLESISVIFPSHCLVCTVFTLFTLDQLCHEKND